MKRVGGIIVLIIVFLGFAILFLLRGIAEIVWFCRWPRLQNMDFTESPLVKLFVDAGDYSMYLIYGKKFN